MAGKGHRPFTWKTRKIRVFNAFVLPILVLGLVSCGSQNTATPATKTASQQEQGLTTTTKTPGEESEITSSGASRNSIESRGTRSLTANSMDLKSVSIEPLAPSAGDTLRAAVVFNEDAPPVTTLYHRWKINGQTVQESPSPELHRPTKKGDQVELIVFVGEEKEESRAVRGYASIGNSLPSVRKVDERLDETGRYVARLEPQDKDGEPVNLTLQRGPEGMTLDGAKRELHWPVPKGTKGSFPVEVLAGDASGGQVLFAYSITIRQE